MKRTETREGSGPSAGPQSVSAAAAPGMAQCPLKALGLFLAACSVLPVASPPVVPRLPQGTYPSLSSPPDPHPGQASTPQSIELLVGGHSLMWQPTQVTFYFWLFIAASKESV